MNKLITDIVLPALSWAGELSLFSLDQIAEANIF